MNEIVKFMNEVFKKDTSKLNHINDMVIHENISELRKFHKYQPERSKREDTFTFKRMEPFTEEFIREAEKSRPYIEIRESDAVL